MEKLSFLCPWCSLFTCSAVVWSCESCLFHLSFFFFFTFAFWLDDMCLGGAVWVIYNSISVLNFVDRRRKVVPLVSSSLFPSLFYWNTLSFALLSHLSADFLLFTNCLCNYYANSLVHLLAVSFVCVWSYVNVVDDISRVVIWRSQVTNALSLSSNFDHILCQLSQLHVNVLLW